MVQTVARSHLIPRTALVAAGGYGFAVACVAFTVGLGFALLTYTGANLGRELLSFAIVIVVWHAGVGPSVLSVLLSIACYDYFFTPPLYVLNVNMCSTLTQRTFLAFSFLWDGLSLSPGS